MTDGALPVYVDTRKIFLQQTQIDGTVALERVSRFRSALASDTASISARLQFSVNKSGQKLIGGQLSADVEVCCQRCLQPFVINLIDDINLVLSSNEAVAAGQLGSKLEPWICEDYRLDLANVVEEQLILCMPIVNYHPGENCLDRLDYKKQGENKKNLAESENHTDSTTNPFSALRTLKK